MANIGIIEEESKALYSFSTDKQAFRLWYDELNQLLNDNAKTSTEKLGLTVKTVREYYLDDITPAQAFGKIINAQ